MTELVPKGQGDEPRISLSPDVLSFISSGKVPTPPAMNAYQCQRRKGHIVITIDMHPGVTPMFMNCRYPHCPGTSSSMGYPSAPMPDILKTAPTFVWYRPSLREMMDLSQEFVDHINGGGLLLRRCPQTVDEFMEEWNTHSDEA